MDMYWIVSVVVLLVMVVLLVYCEVLKNELICLGFEWGGVFYIEEFEL